MQAYLQIIDKVSHRVVQGVQIVDIFVKDLVSFNLLQILRVLLLPLGQNLLVLHDLALENLNMLLERLHLQQALLCLIQINVLVHIRDHTDLALAGC